MNPGTVVICGSNQAGTLEAVYGDSVWILTANGDIWVGPKTQCRLPQDQADLDACPINVCRTEAKASRRRQ